ncbi:response regulator transcription factor [Orrella sp. NBD-18]|uniref:Response regulator transcription factor n=1 Tax=Sheuella amnicola TaxID=2707330 RepID=A0A6B2R316_9BURK|nr:response regulator [Sheuella amnicola]NDY84468.1 response regulator transcription factor [Sheuella amnicola]
MKSYRVIIVDDDEDILDGLTAWLSPDYQVKTFDSAESFLNAINDFDFEDGTPTCILLDFQMPGLNGVELQKRLKQINLEFPIIFMSGNAQQSDIIDAWHEGAVDFILKPFVAGSISSSLEKLFDSTINNLQYRKSSDKNDQLIFDYSITQREAQVLLLLGRGYQQYEAAEILGISLRTVKMYRAALKNKLSLHTLMELGRFFDKHKITIEKLASLK